MVYQSSFCAESVPKHFSDKLQINVMPLVSLKYFFSLMFSLSSSGVWWSNYGLFLSIIIIVMMEMSCWGEAFLKSIQSQNWSSFFKMLTANWSHSNTNTSFSPGECFSLGCETCLVSSTLHTCPLAHKKGLLGWPVAASIWSSEFLLTQEMAKQDFSCLSDIFLDKTQANLAVRLSSSSKWVSYIWGVCIAMRFCWIWYVGFTEEKSWHKQKEMWGKTARQESLRDELVGVFALTPNPVLVHLHFTKGATGK